MLAKRKYVVTNSYGTPVLIFGTQAKAEDWIMLRASEGHSGYSWIATYELTEYASDADATALADDA